MRSRPDGVVLDQGSGNGNLALAAARVGARRVYAVEPTGFARLLPQVFADNGFADRIVTPRGRSQDVELPEKAMVLLSELVSCEPLGEHVLEIVADARRSHLTPEAKILPALTKIRGQIFRPEVDFLKHHEFHAKSMGEWQEHYGFDFPPWPRVTQPNRRRIF
jgi:predicted RNA methylase